jgi:hypothetical protein
VPGRWVDTSALVSTPPAASVATDNRFGAFGAEDADNSEPDLLAGFGLGFATVVGLDSDSAPELSPASAAAAPALPGVVEVIGPPELSTFIPSDASAEPPVSAPELADPSPLLVSPPVASDVPVDVDPAVSVVVSVFDVDASVVEVSVAPVSGPAQATPGVVATATPTPRATAKPPTRPTYLA